MACYLVRYNFMSAIGSGKPPTNDEWNEFKDFYTSMQLLNANPLSYFGDFTFAKGQITFVVQANTDTIEEDFISIGTGSRFIDGGHTETTCENLPITPNFKVRYYNNVTVPNNPGDTPLQTAVYDSVRDGIQKLLDNCSQCNLPKVRVGLLIYAIKQDGTRLAYRIKEIGFDNTTDTVIYYVCEEPSQNVTVNYFQ